MKKLLILIAFCGLIKISFAQNVKIYNREMLDKITDSIETEGKLLHRSDWTSWYGTDIFLAKCPAKRALSGGYISYDSGKGWNNIFFTQGDAPRVIATTSFGYDFNKDKYTFDTVVRKFTPQEKQLFIIRYAALKHIQSDTLFKFYKNTQLNPLAIIINGKKRVYVLTGADLNGVVIFGNDYLINIGDNDSVTSIKKLHKNIIPIASTDTTVRGTMHSHLPETGDFITATDICTLMSYEKRTTWKTHYVISKDYVSIWDCTQDKLVILTKEAWDRINNYHSGDAK